MHVRLGDVLDHNRNVVVPRADSLVVGGGYESTILIYKRDGVHWAQVLIVFLDNLPRIHVILYVGC